MTWILGSAVMFGYGALVSDVRVSFVDEEGHEQGHLDVLQKIYPVGPWMLAGFSGSVEFGFQAVNDLQRFFGGVPEGQSYFVEQAAWEWFRRARRAFAAAPERVKKLSASVILVGASPMTRGPFACSRCMRMRAPLFQTLRRTDRRG